MDAMKLLKIMPKYNHCPQCRNHYIGNGEGSIEIDEYTFTRTCKCGFSITLDENGQKV